MLHTALVVVAVIGIVGYVIGRQLLGEPLRGKRLIVLPLILAGVGALDLGKDGRHPQAIDIAFIVASGVVAAGIGLAQGGMMRLENRNGGLWGQMPVKSLWLWVALVMSRVLIGVVARASGAHVAASTASVLLVLGINRLAQAAVIAPRAIKDGIPFAPEKDGSTFMAGMSTRTSGPVRTLQPTQNQPTQNQPTQNQPTQNQPTQNQPAQNQPATPTWQTSGAQFLSAVGGALQERRSQRGHDDRRRDRRGR